MTVRYRRSSGRKSGINVAGGVVFMFRTCQHRHSAVKPRQTITQPARADVAKMTALYLCQGIGGQAKCGGGLLSRPAPGLDKVTDFSHKLRLEQHFTGIREAQIGVDIAAAFMDLDHFSHLWHVQAPLSIVHELHSALVLVSQSRALIFSENSAKHTPHSQI